MKLQLIPAVVASLASQLGPPKLSVVEEAQKTIQAMGGAGIRVITRRDVSAILLERGVVSENPIPGDDWYLVGDLIRSVSKPEGRRGYYILNEASTPAKGQNKTADLLAEANTEGPTQTAIWVEDQIRTAALDRRLAALLNRYFKQEDFDDLLSFTGEWLARWSAEGTCDAYIAKGKPPPLPVLAFWLRQKMTHQLWRLGKDALSREQKGVRTQFELTKRQELGRDFIHPEALQAGEVGYRVLRRSCQDKDTCGIEGVKDIYRREDATQITEVTDLVGALEEEQLSLVRDIVRVQRGRAGDRYARFFDHLVEGKSREEAAEVEEVSPLRAGHLYQRVRADLRRGPELIQLALKVLEVIADEPYSTLDEIREETGVEEKEVPTAIQLLVARGLAEEAAGTSFCPTDAGRSALFIGALS